MLQACKFWTLTEYRSWGPLDPLTLQDPQWWEDVLTFLRLKAVQEQPVPEWVQEAMNEAEL